MKAKLYNLLGEYMPQAAVDYSTDLWVANPFHFKVTRKRSSKAGDYRYDPRSKQHTITINHDLNRYNFLITYVHEVAHLHTFAVHQNRVPPHGTAWKLKFRELMLPVMQPTVFPEDILKPLTKHMSNPKATTYSDLSLIRALRQYDAPGSQTSLADLSIGEEFLFNKRAFKKGATRRTRVLCEDVKTGKRYLIPAVALVERCRAS